MAAAWASRRAQEFAITPPIKEPITSPAPRTPVPKATVRFGCQLPPPGARHSCSVNDPAVHSGCSSPKLGGNGAATSPAESTGPPAASSHASAQVYRSTSSRTVQLAPAGRRLRHTT